MKHTACTLLIALALVIAPLSCGGEDEYYLVTVYDGVWCVQMHGKCASDPSELTLAGGFLTGSIDVLDSTDEPTSECNAGSVPIHGAAFPRSTGTATPIDFAALEFSGSSALIGAFAFHGALSASGGSGDWWNGTQQFGTFSLTPGGCVPAAP